MFKFSKVRWPPRELQLQEVRLFGIATLTRPLAIMHASNPGGDSPPNQGPDDVIDGDLTTLGSKWLDANMQTTSESTLILQLERPRIVGAYQLFTANDGTRGTHAADAHTTTDAIMCTVPSVRVLL
jgi:hypothetical protein